MYVEGKTVSTLLRRLKMKWCYLFCLFGDSSITSHYDNFMFKEKRRSFCS